MQRIQSSNKAVDLFGVGKNGFGAGNPAGGVLATYVSPSWCNGIQEELMNVIEGAGLAESATLTMLRQAIDIMIQRQAGAVCVAAGTADAMTGDFSPDITAFKHGMRFVVKAVGANTTATPTFKADALAAVTIVKGNNAPLVAGDIEGPNHWLQLLYDLTLNKLVLQNPTITSLFPVTKGTTWSSQLPNGMITQGGKTVSIPANSSITLTFPTAFPVAAVGIKVTKENSDITMEQTVDASSLTRTNVIITNTASVACTCWYEATGY